MWGGSNFFLDPVMKSIGMSMGIPGGGGGGEGNQKIFFLYPIMKGNSSVIRESTCVLSSIIGQFFTSAYAILTVSRQRVFS